jgi:hypothetical protein
MLVSNSSLNYVLLWICTLEFPYYVTYIFSVFGMHWSRQFTASLRNINFLPPSSDNHFTYFSLHIRPSPFALSVHIL